MLAVQDEELFFRIALTQCAAVGDKIGRQLLQQFGSAKDIFNVPLRRLASVDRMGEIKARMLRNDLDRERITTEIAFIRKHGIDPLFITEPTYPRKLKACADAPLMLYYKGTADLNQQRMVAVIGTRKNTDYGLRVTEELIEGLQQMNVIIVSGLAFGIDVIAHRKALQQGIPTLGVMAHGLDSIYPSQHKHITHDMIRNGGLLTEYMSGTQPERFNFPMRNRIVAGMADVTVVVETEEKGGAMITAKLAAGYNREVAAFPGRTIDKKSSGCNYLIRTNMAQLITGAADLLDMMNWSAPREPGTVQRKLFQHLSDDETRIAGILEGAESIHIDEILLKAGFSAPILSSLLLSLELNGAVKALPGKRYRLV